MRFRSDEVDIISGPRPKDCSMAAHVLLETDGLLTAATWKLAPMMRTMVKEAKKINPLSLLKPWRARTKSKAIRTSG